MGAANRFGKGCADIGEGQAALGGDVHRGKLGVRNEIGVEVDEVFARVGVKMGKDVLRSSSGGLALDVGGKHVAHRRLREKFLLGRVETLDAEEVNVRFANERRFAPKADEFGRAFADDACDDHAVNAAGRSRGRRIQIGVAIHPKKIEMFVITAGGGEKADGLGAIAAENEDESAALHGNFGARLEIGQAGDNFVDIASATVFVVFGEHAGSAVAVVDDFEAGGLQAFDETSGAQSGRSFFTARQECGCAGGRANQGNLLLLTGYFDRQESLLKLALPGPGSRPDDPLLPSAITEIWLPESYTVRAISEDGPYKTVRTTEPWLAHRGRLQKASPTKPSSVQKLCLNGPPRKAAPTKTVAQVTQAEAYATKARQRRGAGAMVASSGGNVKRTSSRIRSRSRWSVKPCSARRWLTCSTKTSGAEAPAVSPTLFTPSSHLGSMSEAESMRAALTPRRSATSTRRFELELFCEPTTRMRSTSCATCSTASWRFCVA